MLISAEARAVFVHVQKTGGVTVERHLRTQLPDAEVLRERHAPLTKALQRRPEVADFYVFGFVRNPWARLVSWWSMVDHWHRNGAGAPIVARQQAREAAGVVADDAAQDPMRGLTHQRNRFWKAVAGYGSFERFVLEGPAEWPRLRTPQVAMLAAPGREADFVGRTESLDTDFAAVCERLGVEPPPPGRRNSSGHGHYTDYYDDRTRQVVADLFAADVDRFGYRFGD